MKHEILTNYLGIEGVLNGRPVKQWPTYKSKGLSSSLIPRVTPGYSASNISLTDFILIVGEICEKSRYRLLTHRFEVQIKEKDSGQFICDFNYLNPIENAVPFTLENAAYMSNALKQFANKKKIVLCCVPQDIMFWLCTSQ